MTTDLRKEAEKLTKNRKNGSPKSPNSSRTTNAKAKEEARPVPTAPAEGKVPIWFDQTTGAYFALNAHGEYMRYPERPLSLLLRRAGFSDQFRHSNGMTYLEAEILRITEANSVHFAGPLGGYEPGLYEQAGSRVLLTTRPNIPEPRPGPWPTLKDFLVQLLGPQAKYFCAWIKCAHESLQKGPPWSPGQLLGIAGPGGAGKSFLQSKITPMLAGRVSSPYRYMTGKTNFSAEVYSAEHALIGDQNHKRDKSSRRNFGAAIKEIVANPEAQIRGLYKSGITLYPFVRLSLTLNDNPLALLVLPEMDEDVADKLILLHARRVNFPWPSKQFPDKNAYGKRIDEEIPHFLWHLRRWKIPESISDKRYGVTSFKSPALIKEVSKVSSEAKVWSLIDMYVFSDPNQQSWTGKAVELERILRDRVKGESLERLFDYSGALGSYLKLLAEQMPDKIEIEKGRKDINIYTIQKP